MILTLSLSCHLGMELMGFITWPLMALFAMNSSLFAWFFDISKSFFFFTFAYNFSLTKWCSWEIGFCSSSLLSLWFLHNLVRGFHWIDILKFRSSCRGRRRGQGRGIKADESRGEEGRGGERVRWCKRRRKKERMMLLVLLLLITSTFYNIWPQYRLTQWSFLTFLVLW